MTKLQKALCQSVVIVVIMTLITVSVFTFPTSTVQAVNYYAVSLDDPGLWTSPEDALGSPDGIGAECDDVSSCDPITLNAETFTPLGGSDEACFRASASVWASVTFGYNDGLSNYEDTFILDETLTNYCFPYVSENGASYFYAVIQDWDAGNVTTIDALWYNDASPTSTPTASFSPSPTLSPTNTAVIGATSLPTRTPTPTRTATFTPANTGTPTNTPTPSDCTVYTAENLNAGYAYYYVTNNPIIVSSTYTDGSYTGNAAGFIVFRESGTISMTYKITNGGANFAFTTNDIGTVLTTTYSFGFFSPKTAGNSVRVCYPYPIETATPTPTTTPTQGIVDSSIGCPYGAPSGSSILNPDWVAACGVCLRGTQNSTVWTSLYATSPAFAVSPLPTFVPTGTPSPTVTRTPSPTPSATDWLAPATSTATQTPNPGHTATPTPRPTTNVPVWNTCRDYVYVSENLTSTYGISMVGGVLSPEDCTVWLDGWTVSAVGREYGIPRVELCIAYYEMPRFNIMGVPIDGTGMVFGLIILLLALTIIL